MMYAYRRIHFTSGNTSLLWHFVCLSVCLSHYHIPHMPFVIATS